VERVANWVRFASPRFTLSKLFWQLESGEFGYNLDEILASEYGCQKRPTVTNTDYGFYNLPRNHP
jgi:hypothetical protein